MLKSPLCSIGKVALFFKLNFPFWPVTVEMSNIIRWVPVCVLYRQRLQQSFPSRNHFSTPEMQSSHTFAGRKNFHENFLSMPAALACYILQTHWNKPRCWWAGQREDERTYLHFLGPVCLCSCCLGTDKKLSWPLSRRKGKKGERYMIKGKSSLLQWSEDSPRLRKLSIWSAIHMSTLCTTKALNCDFLRFGREELMTPTNA